MYQGTNPSALRSQAWLTQALLVLLETKKYTEITVKDICKKADLSRQTFYQMFDSKDEIMRHHFAELFAGFKELCCDFDGIGCKEHACQFFHFFYEQRAFVEVLIENNMTYLLEQQFELYLPQISLFQRISRTE
ncbi:MAG: TetR/AcrR family transcriptional regulator, partial [Eubacterium sp.]|nr:TetR/AcrR family transcriptional regulator [Eubacterium sp.]